MGKKEDKAEMLKKERIATFKKQMQEMVATSDSSYNAITSTSRTQPVETYSKEQALKIIHSGDPDELRELSLSFFYTSGFYRRMIMYYATILMYSTLLIPKTKDNKKMNDTQEKSYNNALSLIENINPQISFVEFAVKVLVEGAFYGMVSTSMSGEKSVISLPFSYCRSRFKTYEGVDVVEFNVRYFDTIWDHAKRIECLKTYPQEVRNAYNFYKNKGGTNWYRVPVEDGVHFKLHEERPFLSDIIPAVIDFGEYREIEKARDKQELEKLIVQEMPHLNDGELVFEPEEVTEMHRGIVQMLEGTDGADVVTSFGTIKVEDLQSTRSTVTNNLDKIEKSIYAEAGVSKELFASSTSNALNKAIENDTSLMMVLGNQFANWLQFLVNTEYSKNGLKFRVVMLPLTVYNKNDMFKNALQGAQYGYSFLLPMLTFGFSQGDLRDLKVLENEVLKLQDYMIPVMNTNTMASQVEAEAQNKSNTKTEEEARQDAQNNPDNNINNKKDDDKKSDKTIANENAGGQ